MKNLFRLCCILFSGFIFSQNENPNIIFLIGDGMGLSQISAGMYANGNKTALEDFTTVGLSKTYSSDNLEAAVSLLEPDRELPPFATGPMKQPPEELSEFMMHELCNFLVNPSKAFMRNR
mgnify:CR=1 FL=1